jgi:hypothetical protein
MSKRASSSSDVPSKRQRTRIYTSARSATSTTRSTRYTELRENARGRLNQRRSIQRSTIPLIPDDLDPDNEINEWVEDTEPGQGTSTTTVGNTNATARPAQKSKKTQTRLVRLMSLTLVAVSSPYLQKNLTEWVAFRDSFLDELLRHDGHGDSVGASDTCDSCGQGVATIKCQDCFCQLLRCRECIIDSHKNLPLHRISVS